MGRPGRHATLAFNAALAAWDASASALRWVARQCRRPAAAGPSEVAVGTAGVGFPEGLPPSHYAPSTVCRYGEITARFRAWCESCGVRGCTASDFAGFLAALTDSANHCVASPHGGRHDPRHLGLLRTTICAVRAGLDRPLGLELTAAVRLPPRAQPVPAAPADTVAALRRAALDVRERLLVMLACDLGLRPGQMVALRWGDVSLPRGRLYVDGPKGRLAVAIPSPCRSGLHACARGRAPGDLLLPSPQRGEHGAVTVRTLQNALRRLARRAGVTNGATFASLRKVCPAVSPPDLPSRHDASARRTKASFRSPGAHLPATAGGVMGALATRQRPPHLGAAAAPAGTIPRPHLGAFTGQLPRLHRGREGPPNGVVFRETGA